MNSKCKILTLSSLEANLASENKSSPKMTFKIDVRMAPGQLDFSIMPWPNLIFPPTMNNFYAHPLDDNL